MEFDFKAPRLILLSLSMPSVPCMYIICNHNISVGLFHLSHGRKDYFYVKLSITTILEKLCSFTKLFNSIYVQLSGVKCY